MYRLTLGALAAALLSTTTPFTPVASVASLSSTIAGPPWISIEYPVNPYDATTRDAFLVVHSFHHGTPMNFPVSGTAEGLVNGQRKTVKLDFARTSRDGVFALNKQWSDQGEWTLLISVAQGPEDKVTAVVDLSRGGAAVASVRVPTRMQNNYRVPAAVAVSDIESALRSRSERTTSQR